ncbi:glycoside hydrolase [Brachybacterium saurashtrense]|uniref:Endo-beta-1,6-galactanase-like domain-containing protein n=1 Tax=Brachybacterium saurashtrense TaxID=556288 RepID=A0A345YQX2_9MICO|nr:glycoside hydrolase [Brachybacterium saurashtrense]AXK46324.1 hypothetical protein DWV08_12350 [Brachybacterium saurashtrense]RRR24064.1 hypothetical protein DXU92_04100 [Brachybacterium saurashtrense]
MPVPFTPAQNVPGERPHPARGISRRAVLSSAMAAGAVAGGTAVGASSASAAPAEKPDVGAPHHRLRLDPATLHQRLDGFGASGAWWSQKLGEWTPSARNAVAQLLFSRTQGIGLSQYRYNIGGGIDHTITDPWRTAESFALGDGDYDWDRDSGARWFLQAAKRRGVEDFIAFVNSPPRHLTVNGRTYGDTGTSNLAPENHDAFIDYLIDVVRHFRDEERIDFRMISPINEPQWSWDGPGQEGCHYEPEQVRELTAATIAAFADSGLDTVVSAPEAGEYTSLYSGESYASLLLDDPMIREDIGEFATHSYWSTDEQRALAGEAMKAWPDVPFGMTEWCEMVNGRDSSMDSALTLARTVHADLTLAGVSTWQYWIAVSRYDYHDGLLYTDYIEPGDAETVEETRRLWALGNYSRFLRPGARRIDAVLETEEHQEGQTARIPFVVPDIATGTEPGDQIFRIEDAAGDDAGPGNYTYPSNPVFVPGSCDLLSVEATDAGDDVDFVIRLGADLQDPWNGSPVGYDLQNIDIYLDTRAEGGFTELLPGRRALVADGFAWDRAILASGRTDAIESDVAQKVSATMQEALFVAGTSAQTVAGDTVTVRVPKSFLGDMVPGWALQVVVTGSEGNMESDSLRVREVHREGGEWNFGGGSDGHEDPNILDLLVPEGMTQAEALAWEPATRVEVHACAFLDEETKSLVVVAINESEEPRDVELAVPLEAKSLQLTPFRTTESDSLARGETVRLERGGDGMASGPARLAPRSVTTFTGRWG